MISYTVGDPWNDIIAAEWCVPVDDQDPNPSCEIVSGYYPGVDTDLAGTYTIRYYAEDASGNGTFKDLTITVSQPYISSFDAATYYASAENKTGSSLFNSLRTIIQTGMYKLSYGEIRYLLDESDAHPTDEGNVLTIYDRQSISGVWTGASSNSTYNREHVWPNSRLGVPSVDNSHRNIASDFHNLRAAVVGTNSSRSNKWFDLTTTTDTYYPGEDRGDVARILFYMVVMYPTLDIVNVITSTMDAGMYVEAGTYMAVMSVLLQWHIDDPVDDFERNRNDVIYHYQNNRNPFIDRPQYVSFIWGNNPQAVTASWQFIS